MTLRTRRHVIAFFLVLTLSCSTFAQLHFKKLKIDKGLSLITTIDKLKETQSQLVQSEKMASMGIFTAGVAHEINNPLNFIKGGNSAIEMLLNDEFEASKEKFTPFLTTKPLNVGTGLGMSIAYTIIKRNHGDIESISALQKGTTVRLRFPLSKSDSLVSEKDE